MCPEPDITVRAAASTVLTHISRRRTSADVALRWLRPGSGVEEWSYARLWATAVAAASLMPAPSPSRNTCKPHDEEGEADSFSVTEDQGKGVRAASLRCAGLMVEEGPALAVLELAILLRGYTLVPLSPSDPPARLAFLCRDCDFAFAIAADEDGAARLRASAGPDVPVTLANEMLANADERSLAAQADARFDPTSKLESVMPAPTPSSVSHVFFTSGSTGRPKGCISTHAALLTFCLAKNKAHAIDASSVVFVASPHTFDPSFGDLMATLVAGGTVACATRGDTFAALGRCLAASKATHCTTTPALLETVSSSSEIELPHLKVVALGGEAMSRQLASRWAPPRLRILANTYGTTECCVYQTFHPVTTHLSDDMDCRRLGAPLEGTELVFAAEPGDDPVYHTVAPGSGELAELWIKGPQVGIGYLNRPEQTEDRFQKHGGCWMFRTGDIVRCSEGGAVLVGRRDAQVKLNGQRIELGEVEGGVMRAAGGVSGGSGLGTGGDAGILSSAAAVAVPADRNNSRSSSNGNVRKGKQIIVWCVLSDEAATEILDEKILANAVRKAGKKRQEIIVPPIFHDVLRWLTLRELPRHMVPARLGFLPSLPLTQTGKVARRPLMRRELPTRPAREQKGDNCAGPQLDRSDSLLVAVAKVWSQVLGAPVDTPSAHFAELGGDSLAGLRVCQQLTVLACDGCRAEGDGNSTESSSFAGEAMGSLGPLELMKRQRLSDYVAFLRGAVPDWPGIAGVRAVSPCIKLEIDENCEEDATRQQGEATMVREDNQEGGDGDGEIGAGIRLLYRAAAAGHAALVARLLSAGVPVEGWRHFSSGTLGGNENTLTPLHAACANGRAAAAHALLSAGASVTSTARHGATPLLLAASSKGEGGSVSAASLVHMLLESGASLASLDDSCQSALHAAARVGASAKVLNAIIEGHAHELAHSRIKTKKLLLKRMGPILEWRDAWGRIPLHWASVNGHRGAVTALLAHGASQLLGVRDNAGETAVDAAERRALCSAKERPDGARSSVWGDIATVLGGSGTTKHLKQKMKKKKAGAGDVGNKGRKKR